MIATKLTYGNGDKAVEVDLMADMGVGIGGDRWPAANLFCDFLSNEKWSDFFTNLFLNKKVIELGSGTGLVSILVSKLFQPRDIIVTDQESHMDLIRCNLDNNSSKEVLNKNCFPQTFDWKNFDRANPTKYDIILAFEW